MLSVEGMKAWAVRRRIALVGLLSAGLVYGAAAEINLTDISNIIHEVVVNVLPDLMDLIIGIVPIIMTLAIVGFLVAFFDRILGLIKI